MQGKIGQQSFLEKFVYFFFTLVQVLVFLRELVFSALFLTTTCVLTKKKVLTWVAFMCLCYTAGICCNATPTHTVITTSRNTEISVFVPTQSLCNSEDPNLNLFVSCCHPEINTHSLYILLVFSTSPNKP